MTETAKTLRFVDGQAVAVGTVTRAELLGQGLFETMRWNGKTIPLLDYHRARLQEGARWFGYDPGLAAAELDQGLDTLKLPANEHALVRFQFSHVQSKRGYASSAGQLASLWQVTPATGKVVMPIARLSVSDSLIPPNPGPPVKHTSRADQVVAASHPEAQTAVRCDASGYLREGLSSNLFFLKAGHVCTPRLTDYGVFGTLSAWLHDFCQRQGIPVITGDFPPDALNHCDAVWLTSAAGLKPVQSYSETHYDLEHGAPFNTILDAVRHLFA